MQYNLFDRFNLIINTFTISKTLYVIKINKKNLHRIISKRSQFYRNAYYLTINDFIYNQLVFLNESAINEHIM